MQVAQTSSFIHKHLRGRDWCNWWIACLFYYFRPQSVFKAPSFHKKEILVSHFHRKKKSVLRLLSESLILIGFAMFGATFNLVNYTRRSTVIFGILKDGSLEINSLQLTTVSATSSKMTSMFCQKCFLKTRFIVKKLKISCSLDHTILFKFH